MSGYFEAAGGPDGGAVVTLDRGEISVLRSLTVQLLELIGPGPGEDAEPVDPLEALFGAGPSEPPADPALARLFPDAYGGPGSGLSEDEVREASAEFRRYTEEDLRARKREDGLAVVRDLDGLAARAGRSDGADAGGAGADGAATGVAGRPGREGDLGAVLQLSPEDSRRWLGTLNDLRLALGTRLEIAEDSATEELFALPDGDPAKPLAMAYLWLGALQESLVETLLS